MIAALCCTGIRARLLVLAVALVAITASTAAQTSNEITQLSQQASDLQKAGRYADALEKAERALALSEQQFGSDHATVAARLNMVATLQGLLSRYGLAEENLKRAIAIREKTPGPNSAELAQSIGELALQYRNAGRYADADPLFKRSLAIYEKGNNLRPVGIAMGNLADNYRRQGRFSDAEPLYKRALEAHAQALGPEHEFIATTLSNLATMMTDEGRYREAEPLFERASAIYEKALAKDHPAIGLSIGNLATNRYLLRRFDEAEVLYKRALESLERSVGPNHPHTGVALISLAGLYRQQQRYIEAEPLFQRGIEVQEKLLGPGNVQVATSLANLAAMYQQQNRHADAEPLLRRVLSIREKALGPDHRLVGSAFNSLAVLHFAREQWDQAVELLLHATELVVRNHERNRDGLGIAVTGRASAGETDQQASVFVRLIKAGQRLRAADRARFPQLEERIFAAAQWMKSSETAASLTQMSVRQAKGDAALANAIRERQDLVNEWRARDAALLAAAVDQPARRNPEAEKSLRAKLIVINARIKEIDQLLAASFPNYSALANPQPLTVAEVQAYLNANEALVYILDTGDMRPLSEETFIWVVTKTLWRSVRVDRGTRTALAAVAALRCGLDRAAWDGEGGKRCATNLKHNLSAADLDAGKPLPFDLERAYTMYRALFGGIEDIIKDKQLLVVASGPFTALPFHVLVTEKPVSVIPENSGDYANAAWIIKRHPITVLPSVASLKALRQLAKASGATQPFVGFGNPLLTGPSGSDRRAWQAQSCAPTPAPVRVASRTVSRAASELFRNGRADVAALRAQYPLPETTDELCLVARLSGASDDAVYLGERATEKTVKSLSAAGTLANARIVHFATHGLLAGETQLFAAAKAEPALILTPPEAATEEDDGLLTASEVAELRLDADWVVLSACNTAAGVTDAPGAEALSGLARAFFYAGARSLLVSHWAVDSQATVRLITGAFDALKSKPKLGNAEALRQSILTMIASGGRNAHPSLWSPFVLVGASIAGK